MSLPPLHAALLSVHAAVDQAVGILAPRHPLQCGPGCTSCCIDGLTVFEVEADRIRREYPEVLASRPHARGWCAMLDAEGRCRVYGARPYVCRTQGLPLRWLGAQGERRDICPLNERPEEPVEDLPSEDCWTLGPVEDALRQIQGRLDGGALKRVSLRSLFPPRSRKSSSKVDAP